MMSRIERTSAHPQRDTLTRRRRPLIPLVDEPESAFALVYSNGYVTVEISHEALDAYVETTGDVPLPWYDDPQTGDRHLYDARNDVRVVYDPSGTLREIAKRSNDGLFVRMNFVDGD
jgi:hypothetical protein